MNNKEKLEKATIIAGIAATEKWDFQGEKLLLSGADISEMVSKGFFNADHAKGFQNLLGKITEAKKIMSERDIDNEQQRTFWEKNEKKPYLFVKGYLFDDPEGEHIQAKAVGAIVNQFKKVNSPLTVALSVEGKVVDRDNSGVIKESIIRNVAMTVTPANDATGTDVVSNEMAGQIITKCKEIGADVNYATDLIKNINSGIKPVINQFIEIPYSDIEKLRSVQTKLSKAVSLIKMLSAGYGSAGAPTARTGGSTMMTESVDPKVKSVTLPPVKKDKEFNVDEGEDADFVKPSPKKNFGGDSGIDADFGIPPVEEDSEKAKKKKAKKAILKSLIDKVRKNHPNLPYEKVVEYSMEIFRSKKQ